MKRLSTIAPRHVHRLATVALLGTVAVLVPLGPSPFGSWTEVARKLVATRFGHDATPTAEHPAVTAVRTESTRLPGPPSDGRFSFAPASQLVVAASPVTSTGFIGLPPSVASKGPTADASLERASLPDALQQTALSSPGLGVEVANSHQAIAFYRKGSVAEGDAYARLVTDGDLRIAIEWVAVRFDPRETGIDRLRQFVRSHPDWPMAPWIGRRIEELTLADMHDAAAIRARFAVDRPQTLYGRFALARADLGSGDEAGAGAIIRDVWRTAELSAVEETALLKEFGTLLGRADHKFRADRLLYKEQLQPALRAATLAGPDIKLLALARASVIGKSSPPMTDAAFAAVPSALADDPGLVFSRIQRARRADKIREAADLMQGATRDPALLVNGDEWWVERRMLARKLLDEGDARAAYAICANHGASSDASAIEAEFHAGWIALRFLDEPDRAAGHFAKAADDAGTPISKARVAYWQGRAADAAGKAEAARSWYAEAATQPISFYGQLASGRLGRSAFDLRRPAEAASGPARREAVRVIEQLYALGERDIALPLAFEIAKSEPSDAQVAALAAVLTRANDARATLLVGKFATQRGLPLDGTAFPTFGIPAYQPLGNSADRAVVYAIARQESEFDPRSVSSAGAKGLMQMIASTARQTATKNGVAFDDNRLLSDSSFNAQLGAAHLGQLLAEQRGSYILTFAAYNAGSQRVKEWIARYGDPRTAGVDPVDWIERIPFTETRNYVQRVFENLQVYRSLLGQSSTLLVGADVVPKGKGT